MCVSVAVGVYVRERAFLCVFVSVSLRVCVSDCRIVQCACVRVRACACVCCACVFAADASFTFRLSRVVANGPGVRSDCD